MEIFGSSVNLGTAALIEEIPSPLHVPVINVSNSVGIKRHPQTPAIARNGHGPKFRPEHLSSPAPPGVPIDQSIGLSRLPPYPIRCSVGPKFRAEQFPRVRGLQAKQALIHDVEHLHEAFIAGMA